MSHNQSGGQEKSMNQDGPPIVTNNDIAQMIMELREEQSSHASKIQSSLAEIKLDINKLKSDLQETNTSLEFAHEGVRELKLESSKSAKAVDDLQAATQALQAAEKAASAQLNALESYNRQWSLRVSGLRDGDADQPCIDQIALLVGNLNVSTSAGSRDPRATIENAHWLGSREGRPRQAIVRFFSREVRNTVLRNAKKSESPSKIIFYEDMTKADYAAKKLARPEMMKIWNSGHYVKFNNGKIITGGIRK